MDSNKDIFQQFQDRQSAWDETPPASAWERLEARLDAEPPSHPGRPWKPFVLPGIGMVLLFIFLGWGLLQGSDKSALSSQEENASFGPLVEQRQRGDQDQGSNRKPDQDQSWNDGLHQNHNQVAPLNPDQGWENEQGLQDGNQDFDPGVRTEPYASVTVPGPQEDTSDINFDPIADLGNPALEPMPYQRMAPPTDLGNLLPTSNVGNYNYANSNLNPGNMVITNERGNVIDTVGSISQYGAGLTNPNDISPGYLQMNATRNDISYSPRGNHRNSINPSALDHFNWLLGSWKYMGPSGSAISFEEWERKDAFSFEGRGFLVVNGDTLITEKMRIEQRGENVYYIAALDTNQTPMRFRLRSNTPGEAVFKNPGEGFPNEVILRQTDDGTLETNFNNGKTNPRKREEIIRNLSRD